MPYLIKVTAPRPYWGGFNAVGSPSWVSERQARRDPGQERSACATWPSDRRVDAGLYDVLNRVHRNPSADVYLVYGLVTFDRVTAPAPSTVSTIKARMLGPYMGESPLVRWVWDPANGRVFDTKKAARRAFRDAHLVPILTALGLEWDAVDAAQELLSYPSTASEG